MRILIGLLCGSALWATSSAAAEFRMQQVAILGGTSVNATGINDAGAIIGTFMYGSQAQPEGFVQQGSSLWLLGTGQPTHINNAGAVVGYGYQTSAGFLWQNGTFAMNVNCPVGGSGNAVFGPIVSSNGKLVCTGSSGGTPQVYAGQSAHIHKVRGLSKTLAVANSVNASGVMAGYEYATIQGQGEQVIFVGKGGLFDILPQISNDNFVGGFVNDAGEVAYSNSAQGFISGGEHGTINFAPPSPADGLSLSAMNNAGRVVGTYVDTSANPSVQHAFLFNGAVFTPFGTYAAADTVHVALSDHGAMVVSDQSPNGGPSVSYLVKCKGDGC